MKIAAIIIVALLLLVVLWFFATYNGLVKLRNLVQEAWRQIDVELTRRHDLIPNLVETVKGYASHERATLEEVMRARSSAMTGGQSPAQQAQSEGMLSQALGRLFAVAEAYPDLKANVNFQQLMSELTQTEDRIASARRYYNATVRDLNTRIEVVPSNIVAGIGGFKQAEYFEAEGAERDPVKVDFGTAGPGGSAGAGVPSVGGPVAPGAPSVGGFGAPEVPGTQLPPTATQPLPPTGQVPPAGPPA